MLTGSPRPATSQTSTSNDWIDAAWGIRGITLTPALNQALNLATDQKGILVEQVEPGSPAAQAGVRGGSETVTINGNSLRIGGDVIVAVDGQSIASVSQLQTSLPRDQVRQVITLVILRAGRSLNLQVTLGAAPTTTP